MLNYLRCRRCKETKLASVETFIPTRGSETGYTAWCRDCIRAVNPDSKGGYRKQYKQDWIAAYLQDHPCVDCKNNDFLVLEFDHIPGRGIKKQNVMSMVANSKWSISDMIVEIEKCEVVCRNCHAKRTASRCDSWRMSYVQATKGLDYRLVGWPVKKRIPLPPLPSIELEEDEDF